MIDTLGFLSEERVRELAAAHQTPFYVYSRKRLQENAQKVLHFSAPFGFKARYAMKANPNPDIIAELHSLGLGIDASSGYEAEKAMEAGVKPQDIHIASQQLPNNLQELLDKGVNFIACSLHQLETYGKLAPNTKVGVRINPGKDAGAGLNNRMTTAGITTSFGIWHEYIDKIYEIAAAHGLTIDMVHTHVGSGGDPKRWLAVTKRNIDLLDKFPDATKTSIGGGFKVGRMDHEETADLEKISAPIGKLLEDFYKRTGRKIHLEIEPGSFLVVNAGSLVSKIVDIKDTGTDGFNFLVINAGMTEILRPAMYGAQHRLVVVPKNKQSKLQTASYAVSGHCCESGDMLTVAQGDPETLEPRLLQTPSIGDYLVVEDVGAYCASMRAIGYNSFPVAKEVLVD